MAQINYVREHMAFIEYATDKGLTGNERTFWYALIHLMNRQANGVDWPEGFVSVSNKRLLALVPFGENKIPAIRNRLKQVGLIDFRPGSRNARAPEYQMHYLTAGFCHKNGDKTGNTDGCKDGNTFGIKNGNTDGCKDGNLYVNLNVNPTKRNAYADDDEEAEELRVRDGLKDAACCAIRREYGREATAAEADRIASVALSAQMTAEMIDAAVSQAALCGARSPALYAARMLCEWQSECVMTRTDLDEYRTIQDGLRGRLLYAVTPEDAEAARARRKARRG